MATHHPPSVSGISGATLCDLITVSDLERVCRTLKKFEPHDICTMQRHADTVNMALLDYLTRIRSRESRSSAGAIKDWADHIARVTADLSGSLGFNGQRHSHLEAWQILRSALPRKIDSDGAFDQAKRLAFKSAPDAYQKILQQVEQISNQEIYKLFDVIFKRSLRDLQFLHFVAERAANTASSQIANPGGKATDYERRLLIAALVPVYHQLTGRPPSGSNPEGPTTTWLMGLFNSIAAKAECPPELSRFLMSRATAARWIVEALETR